MVVLKFQARELLEMRYSHGLKDVQVSEFSTTSSRKLFFLPGYKDIEKKTTPESSDDK